jgi:hypothetical protein
MWSARRADFETNAQADSIAFDNGDNKTLPESLFIIQETSAKFLDDLLRDERFRPSPGKGTPLEETRGATKAESAFARQNERANRPSDSNSRSRSGPRPIRAAGAEFSRDSSYG